MPKKAFPRGAGGMCSRGEHPLGAVADTPPSPFSKETASRRGTAEQRISCGHLLAKM